MQKKENTSLSPEDKEKLLSKRAEWYNSLNSEEKEKLLSDRAECYSSLNPKIKKSHCLTEQNGMVH